MIDDPSDPPANGPAEDLSAPERWVPELAGFVPPDPDEPPPVELWSAVGDVLPWGTVVLMLAWAAMFALLRSHHLIGDGAGYITHGASLAERPTGANAWRLLASTFLHDGYAHLFFNSLSMLLFGPPVERIFGRWAFWTVFAFGGVAASLASVAWRMSREAGAAHISIGASGALFALAGALLTGAWRLRHRLAIGRARALAAAILFFAAPAIAQGFQRVGTDNAAHVGGVTAGLLLGAIVPLSPRLGGPRAGPWVALPGALGVLGLAASFVRAWLGG